MAVLSTLAEQKWPQELLQPAEAIKKVVADLPSCSVHELASMCTAWKVKNTIDKKDKPKMTKMIIQVPYKFDFQGSSLEMEDVLGKMFLHLSFKKSLSGPPPSMLETKVSKKLGK